MKAQGFLDPSLSTGIGKAAEVELPRKYLVHLRDFTNGRPKFRFSAKGANKKKSVFFHASIFTYSVRSRSFDTRTRTRPIHVGLSIGKIKSDESLYSRFEHRKQHTIPNSFPPGIVPLRGIVSYGKE